MGWDGMGWDGMGCEDKSVGKRIVYVVESGRER
jgi:hypothetical protein